LQTAIRLSIAFLRVMSDVPTLVLNDISVDKASVVQYYEHVRVLLERFRADY